MMLERKGIRNQLKHQKNYKIKYDINSRIPKDWDVENLGKLLSYIKLQIFTIMFTKCVLYD